MCAWVQVMESEQWGRSREWPRMRDDAPSAWGADPGIPEPQVQQSSTPLRVATVMQPVLTSVTGAPWGGPMVAYEV